MSAADRYHALMNSLSFCADGVQSVSDRLASVGLNVLASELAEEAQAIRDIRKRLWEEFDVSLNQSLADAQQATVNLFAGVLAGISIGQKDEEKQS